MATPPEFETIKPLSAAINGGCNIGIYVVKDRRTGNIYVDKRLPRSAINSGYTCREVRAMLQCSKHPNIIRIHAYNLNYSRSGYGSIIMQQCELGSIDGLITNYSQRKQYLPDEGFLWKVFWDVSLAFCHLWTGRSVSTTRIYANQFKSVEAHGDWNSIIHRDIKPANLFVTWKDQFGDNCHYPTIVVGDFGLCTSIEDIRTGRASSTTMSGYTPDFKPPEAPQFCARGDIYQLALSIHCLARMSDMPDMDHSLNDNHPLPRRYRDSELRRLLVMCLQRNPDKRPYPQDLPALVWRGYKAWRKLRLDDGEKLPSWAFN
jgi:serine/threonine protein kinase